MHRNTKKKTKLNLQIKKIVRRVTVQCTPIESETIKKEGSREKNQIDEERLE